MHVNLNARIHCASGYISFRCSPHYIFKLIFIFYQTPSVFLIISNVAFTLISIPSYFWRGLCALFCVPLIYLCVSLVNSRHAVIIKWNYAGKHVRKSIKKFKYLFMRVHYHLFTHGLLFVCGSSTVVSIADCPLSLSLSLSTYK